MGDESSAPMKRGPRVYYMDAGVPECQESAEQEWEDTVAKVEALRSRINRSVLEEKNIQEFLLDGFAEDTLAMESSFPTESKQKAVRRASKFMFEKRDKLDWDFVASINAVVLGSEPGERSSRRIMPASALVLDDKGKTTKVPYVYTLPQHINVQMSDLLGYANKEVVGKLPLQEKIANAADFFIRFLTIHPFANGNGRTARILFSWFFRVDFPIPIALVEPSRNPNLYTAERMERGNNTQLKSRTWYILSLQAAREQKNFGIFERYVLDAIHAHLDKIIRMFDVE